VDQGKNGIRKNGGDNLADADAVSTLVHHLFFFPVLSTLTLSAAPDSLQIQTSSSIQSSSFVETYRPRWQSPSGPMD
jgi:hypothetical protein